jgi:hypothetical protein
LQQLGTIYKKDKLYFKVDLEPKVEEDYEVEELPPVAKKVVGIPPSISFGKRKKDPEVRFEPAAKIKTAAPQIKKFGRLRRNSISGPYAMALYLYWRHDGLAIKIEKLLEVVGETKAPSFYVALSNMVTGDYIKKVGYGTYVWSGTFDYPFSSVADTDQDMVKNLPPSMRGIAAEVVARQEKPVLSVVEAVKTDPTATVTRSTDEDTTLGELDFLIANLQSNTGTTATAFVSGGVVDATEKLTCRIVTTGGRTDERTIDLKILER